VVDRGSAAGTTFEGYLHDHPGSAALVEAVRRALASAVAEPVAERLTRSQLAFRRRVAFAWVWAPGRYLGEGRAPLVLSVAFGHRDRSPRWKEVVEVRPGRVMHHLELRRPSDVDTEVGAWLAAAWAEAD
jgi:hypothetical protein